MNIYKDKVVLVTGHTGFKGSWLSIWLHSLGAKVIGLSLDVPSEPSNFRASAVNELAEDHRIDVRDAATVADLIIKAQPDFVFHLAAQALVRPSYASPLDTLTTNAIGTANILDALRQLNKKVVAVMITSDKAYDNVEWVWGYRESDRLGGKDPYSASKGMAELAIRTYVESFFANPENCVRVGITRAGNVIGGGDWAVDRIVPDCIKAWSCGDVVDVRNPKATRPWQHVLEPLSGYLSLGHALFDSTKLHGEAFNFGPPAHMNHTVEQLIESMSEYWERVRWNDVSSDHHLHEAGLLKLNCDKALFDLGWQPTLGFKDTVRMTVQWYKTFYDSSDAVMREVTLRQIAEYTQLAHQRGIQWASI